jgi:hypothetical protein
VPAFECGAVFSFAAQTSAAQVAQAAGGVHAKKHAAESRGGFGNCGLFVAAIPNCSTRQRSAGCGTRPAGKIGHELAAERKRRQDSSTAIVFLEQIHPFPEKELETVLGEYSSARDFVWVQEEPANMGALNFVMPRLERVLRGRAIRSVKRSASASPATGSAKAHEMEQKTLLALAFGTGKAPANA